MTVTLNRWQGNKQKDQEELHSCRDWELGVFHVIVMITACLAKRKRLGVAREHNIFGKNEVVPLHIFILLSLF